MLFDLLEFITYRIILNVKIYILKEKKKVPISKPNTAMHTGMSISDEVCIHYVSTSVCSQKQNFKCIYFFQCSIKTLCTNGHQ